MKSTIGYCSTHKSRGRNRYKPQLPDSSGNRCQKGNAKRSAWRTRDINDRAAAMHAQQTYSAQYSGQRVLSGEQLLDMLAFPDQMHLAAVDHGFGGARTAVVVGTHAHPVSP